jgi:hypothetical protein
VAGTAAALLCASNDLYVSPVAAALDGADLSAFVGPVVGACLYAALVLRQRSRSAVAGPAIRPMVAEAAAE